MPRKKNANTSAEGLREFRVYFRPNLQSGANSYARSLGPPGVRCEPKTPAFAPPQYRCTLRHLGEIEAWLGKVGDKTCTYLIEKWDKGERLAQQIPSFDSGPVRKRNFVQKWCWDARNGWHQASFVHASERA